MQYTIWIVSPANYPHSRCFEEVAQSLNAAFLELGHECKIVKSSFECRGRTVILGANLLSYIPTHDLPNDIIIWNLEQIFEGSPWLSSEYVALLKGRHGEFHFASTKKKLEIWDYSQKNIDALDEMGISAKLCEIGYMPCLTKIENSPVQDIDFLHYGSLNPRRQEILQELTRRGLKVRHAFNEYGVSRDALIARSKIVLNVHFYTAKVFEIVRCSYLMANRKCIVSENSIEDYDGVYGVPYDALVDSCVDLLGNEERREELAQTGFESFKKKSQTEYLRRVL